MMGIDRLDLPLDKNSDFYQDVKLGLIPGYEIVEKFGFGELTTTLQPVTISGQWRTPKVLTSLEILSDDANDALGLTGIDSVFIEGIGADWLRINDTVSLNGLSAVALNKDFYRIDRVFGLSSGTYASTIGGSHDSTLTIREVGAGQIWTQIDSADTGFGKGQSQIACATIEKGCTGFVISKHIFIESNKTASIYFFQRNNADDIVAPYSGVMRLVEQELGAEGQLRTMPKGSFGGFVGACDIGFMGRVPVGTANISIDFEILKVDNNLLNL